jgi:flagellar biosynthetic protein FlhB
MSVAEGEGSEQDKSEKATPFKLAQARRKGMVARGADLGFLSVMAGFCVFVWMRGGWSIDQFGRAFREAFNIGPRLQDGAGNLYAVMAAQGTLMAGPVVAAIAIIFLFAMLLELAQTGFVFSTAPLRLDFGKLNPAKGLKRVFSKQMLIELGKTLLKTAIYGGLTGLAVLEASKAFAAARALDETTTIALGIVGRLLAQVLLAALVFAALDQAISRRTFAHRMRMSRRDLRREVRDREGEPHQKQQRKRQHAEYVKNSRSMKGIRGADALIVNPNHFAVALRYDPRAMGAPEITASGRDAFALRLKSLATLCRVPIIEDPPLARLLFRYALGQTIPETSYERVAAIYRRLEQDKAEQARE